MGESGPTGIAVNATSVVFAADFLGEIRSVPLAGGSSTQVSQAGKPGANALAITPTQVYWTSPAEYSIYSAPIGGGAAMGLLGGQGGPSDIGTAGTFVFWAAHDDGKIWRLGQSDMVLVPIASSQIGPWNITTDATFVYWTSDVGGTVRRSLQSGNGNGVVQELYKTSGSSPGPIGVSGNQVFFSVRDDGSGSGAILRVDKDGTNLKRLGIAANPGGLTVDGVNVYWTEPGTGAVMYVSINGGVPTLFAQAPDEPLRIATDSAYVYWTNHAQGAQGKGSVVKLAKP
jgi:hypothetical protein